MSGIATHIAPLTMFIMVIIITIFRTGRMEGVDIGSQMILCHIQTGC